MSKKENIIEELNLYEIEFVENDENIQSDNIVNEEENLIDNISYVDKKDK